MHQTISMETGVLLNNGIPMPVLGFGTYRQTSGPEARGATLHAIRSGYRLIDTASMYGNEKDVGEALRESGRPREQLFITTKLWSTDHGYDQTIAACSRSLRELKLDYVDLYLIHWPEGGRLRETWRAMRRLVEEGACRAAGVCNFSIPILKKLMSDSPLVPAVHQFECNPFLHDDELLAFCKDHRIQAEAHRPLAKGTRLFDPLLNAVAVKNGKTPAQVCIRWAIQKRAIPIPKSSHAARIEENARVFDFSLSAADMKTLDSLNRVMGF